MTLAVGTKVRCVVEPYDTEHESFELLGKTGVVVDNYEVMPDYYLMPEETTVKWDDFLDGWAEGDWDVNGPYWAVDDTDLEVIDA